MTFRLEGSRTWLFMAAGALAAMTAVACGSDDDNSGGGGSGGQGNFAGTGGTGGGTGGSGGSGGGFGGSGGTAGGGGTAATGGTGGTGGTGATGGTAGTAGTAGTGGVSGSGQTAFIYGDFDTNNTYQVAKIEAPSTKTLLTLAGLGGEDISAMAVSPDGTKLVVAGEDTSSSPATIMVYNADGTGGTALATAPSAGRTVNQVAVSPDNKWVAFLADFDATSGVVALFVVPIDGSSAAKQLSPAITDDNLDVTQLAWAHSVDGAHAYLAFTGDLVQNSVFGLWIVDALAATPAPVEIVSQAELGSGGDVGRSLGWDSTNKLIFSSNYENNGTYRLYAVDADGQNRTALAATQLTNGAGEASVGAFAVSPSGTKIAFDADAPTDGLGQVYVWTLSGSAAPAQVSNVQTAALSSGFSGVDLFGDTPILWSPDESVLGVTADWQVASGDADNAYSAFVLPTSGTPGGTRVLGSPSDGAKDVVGLAWSADSKRLFMRADMVNDNDFELYSTTDFATADQAAMTLRAEETVAGGDVLGLVAAP